MVTEIENLKKEIDYLRELVSDVLRTEDYKKRLGRLKNAKIRRCPCCLRPIE